MLRSAAHAGASIADARTNANTAVLAHSDFSILTLNRTLPALAREDTPPPTGLALLEQIRAPPTGAHELAGFKSRFPGSVAPAPQALIPGGFSANLPSTCAPLLARFHWPGRARSCTCR